MKRWPGWEKGVWIAFLAWSLAGLIFTLGHVSPEEVGHWSLPGWLRDFIAGCLRVGDPLLILLAFANTHLHAARQRTPPLARRWALVVLVSSLGLETIGVSTGFPFGAYAYTERFGPLIGIVPLTIPLAWHIVVTNGLFVARAILRHRSRLAEAGLTGLICTLYDAVLEPFATVEKHYWLWRDGVVPLQNYAAWFVLSGLLVWWRAPTLATRFPRDRRPVMLLGVTLLIFVAGRWS